MFAIYSRNPLLRDPYEDETVTVGDSQIPLAGEGLFARRKILRGELICMFNGLKIDKPGRTCKAIVAGSEDWSDYRLTLGMLRTC